MQQLLKFYPTHELLKKYVLHYVVWKRSAAYAEEPKLFLPNNVVGIGFVLSGNLVIHTEKERILAPVCGMRNIYHHARSVETEGEFYNISVRFKPYGLKAFTPLHCSELFRSECVDIEVLFGTQLTKEIHERLLHVSSDKERVAILEHFLLEVYMQEEDRLLEAIVDVMNKSPQQIRINELANRFGTTERRIHRLFSKHIGIPPKDYSSLIRFRKIMRSFGTKQEDILGIALEAGYFDQSHFIKDFRSFTGMTPSAFMEEQKRVSDFYNL